MRTWLAKAAIVSALAFGAGCTVHIADYAERACDDAHACLDGWVCQAGRCVVAGTSDAGAPDAGGDEPGGCVRWRQAEDAFTSNSVCPTCMLSLDSAQQNQLTAIIPSAVDGSDSAYARLVGSALEGTGSRGKLRGRVYVPDGARIDDDSSFLELRTSTGAPLLELYFTHSWELGFNSAAGLLQSSPTTAESVARFDPGAAYLVEAEWERGGFVRLFVNGATVINRTLTPVAGGSGPSEVTELRLGIVRYAGDAAEGWTIVASEWLLCDDPEGEVTP